MANVYTAEQFGLNVPGDAYERMAQALKSESWTKIEGQSWFESAQTMATDERFFHWELEFPVAFYDENGDRKADAGFDAVIGNPPYLAGREWDEDLREARPFFQERYSCMSDQYDLFALFIQLGVGLTNKHGRFGFITPNTWLNNSHYEELREWLLEKIEVRGIGDFRSVNVFPEATVLPIVFTAERMYSPEASEFPIDRFKSPINKNREWSTTDAWNLFDGTVFSLSVRKNDFEILKKIDRNSHQMSDYCASRFGVKVYQKNKGKPPQSGEEAEQDVFRSKQKEGDDYYPYVRGRDVSAWHVDSGDRWIKYGPHLAEPRSIDLFDDDRIFVRRIVGSRLILSPVTETIIADQLLHTVKPTSSEVNNSVVAAFLRSRLTAYYFKKRFNRDEETFPEIRVSELDSLPIKLVNKGESNSSKFVDIYQKEIKEGKETTEIYNRMTEKGLQVREDSPNLAGFIEEIVEKMVDMSSSRNSLNLSLLDYLGNYAESAKLPDIGLFQPASSNILDTTTEEYQNLRVGDVKTDRDGSSVTISAKARYKPEDDDAHVTDQWGYTETGYHKAFVLMNLSDEEATLIEEFVPLAAEKADGFAGFRDNATKTNSLNDRLKEIVLPEIDDIAEDLERYIKVKTRADQLDTNIKKTDQLFDEIVYELYNITEEEASIIESAVEND